MRRLFLALGLLAAAELGVVGRALRVNGEDAHALGDAVGLGDALDAEPRGRRDGVRGDAAEEALDGADGRAERDGGAGVPFARSAAAAEDAGEAPIDLGETPREEPVSV